MLWVEPLTAGRAMSSSAPAAGEPFFTLPEPTKLLNRPRFSSAMLSLTDISFFRSALFLPRMTCQPQGKGGQTSMMDKNKNDHVNSHKQYRTSKPHIRSSVSSNQTMYSE